MDLFRTGRSPNADLARTLGNGNEHDIGHAYSADQQREKSDTTQKGCEPEHHLTQLPPGLERGVNAYGIFGFGVVVRKQHAGKPLLYLLIRDRQSGM